MALSIVLTRLVLGFSVAANLGMGLPNHVRQVRQPAQPMVQPDADTTYGKLPACAPIKGKPAVRAKSTDVLGAKKTTKTLQCFTVADVNAGKKILNGFDKACFACHSTVAQYSPNVMIANLRAQGDGKLTLANITAINAAHLGEMAESVPTASELKKVRAYLKCKFNG